MNKIELFESFNGMVLDDALYEMRKVGSLDFVDEKIDDGIDDENSEDNYLIMRSYDIEVGDDESYYIRLYYGNNTRKIGFVDAEKDED